MNWLIAAGVAYFLLKKKGLDVAEGLPSAPVLPQLPIQLPSEGQDVVAAAVEAASDVVQILVDESKQASSDSSTIPVSDLQACLSGFGRCGGCCGGSALGNGRLRSVRGRWMLSRR